MSLLTYTVSVNQGKKVKLKLKPELMWEREVTSFPELKEWMSLVVEGGGGGDKYSSTQKKSSKGQEGEKYRGFCDLSILLVD